MLQESELTENFKNVNYASRCKLTENFKNKKKCVATAFVIDDDYYY